MCFGTCQEGESDAAVRDVVWFGSGSLDEVGSRLAACSLSPSIQIDFGKQSGRMLVEPLDLDSLRRPRDLLPPLPQGGRLRGIIDVLTRRDSSSHRKLYALVSSHQRHLAKNLVKIFIARRPKDDFVQFLIDHIA
ncbi:hypothetical protein D1007_33386 [Hordeum vulgare]|nr:hypothetical protein D1007_33386 [Hordeum vulgare]